MKNYWECRVPGAAGSGSKNANHCAMLPPTDRELKKTMKKVQARNLDKGNSDNGNYWMLTRWSRKSIVDTKLFNLVVENSST